MGLESKDMWNLETEDFGTVYALKTKFDIEKVVGLGEPHIVNISKVIIRPNGQYLKLDNYPHGVSYLDVSRAPNDELDGLLAALESESFEGTIGKELLMWNNDHYKIVVTSVPQGYKEQEAVRATEEILRENQRIQ